MIKQNTNQNTSTELELSSKDESEEKKQQRRLKSETMFLNTVSEHGGVLSASEAAKRLELSTASLGQLTPA